MTDLIEHDGYDASDPKQVKRRELEQQKRDLELRNALKETLANPVMRNWVWDLMQSGGIYESSFVRGDSYATTHNEGRRSFALQILKDIDRLVPDILFQMMQEHAKK